MPISTQRSSHYINVISIQVCLAKYRRISFECITNMCMYVCVSFYTQNYAKANHAKMEGHVIINVTAIHAVVLLDYMATIAN